MAERINIASVADLCATKSCITPHVDDAKLCDDHIRELHDVLTEAIGLEDDLQITIARQARMSENTGGGKPAERPLPFHWNGADAAWGLAHTLSTWARVLAVRAGIPVDLDAEQVPPRERHARAHLIAVPSLTVEREVEHVDETSGETIVETVVETIPARYHDDPAAMPHQPGPAARAAHWIDRHLDQCLRHPQVGEILDELRDAVGRTRHVIDRAPTRWFAGACDLCGTAMYSRPEARRVYCPNANCEMVTSDECGGMPGGVYHESGECPEHTGCAVREYERTWYDVDARRAWLLDAAQDYLATAVEATVAVPALAGIEINVNTLRQAGRARDGHQPELRTDHTHPDGRPRYRLGDVIELAQRMAVRRAS